jgi:hypothetical protein
MKTTKEEQVTRTYCDVCSRELTNKNQQSLAKDTVHLCLSSPNDGVATMCNWKNKWERKGQLPSCSDMYAAGVRKVVMEQRS